MSTHAVALVGTGEDPDEHSSDGFAMAYTHADAYESIDACEIVACVDIIRENAEAFAAEHDVADTHVYEDHATMLSEADPDIVSVCVPPAAHAEIVTDCARHPSVRAIHCEKPMALTWGGSRRMAEVASETETQLTFNHQRRFGKPFREAKKLLDSGAVGDLERVGFAAENIYDYGSHSIDLCNYFAGEKSAEWVIGGIDYRTEDIYFGAHNENQAILNWEYENGVQGLGATGPSETLVGAHNRIVGSRGVIEVGPHDIDESLRVRRDGDRWETVDTGEENMHGPGYIRRALQDAISTIGSDRESEIRAENALNATEIIFGCWESSRRRGRVDFPLLIDDNPLEAMVESGDLQPDPPEGDG
jgi:UDP-N-acetylglucosamine 3-dehydrogenase